ncbi:MAG: hypothetical protein ACREXY_23355, partial [Gammaproteobacteria bacterium]
LLALSLAAVCSGAVATESGVQGAGTMVNDSIVNTNWDAVVSTTVTPDATFPAGNTYYCAVTCTATFQNTSYLDPGNDANYYLGISKNGELPPDASRRVISFPENVGGVDDADWGPIATTYLFSGSGTTTFSCRARKHVAADPTGIVENASITASCSDHRWQ